MTQKRRIAIVKNGEFTTGGISSVCEFIYQTITSTKRYDVRLFSLETSYRNPNNISLLSTKSWLRGIQTTEYTWHNLLVTHIGAFLPEFEFFRYMPRRSLTAMLSQYDLIQIVSGSPAAAYVTKHLHNPVCLFVATLTRLERISMLRKGPLARRIYGYAMLPIISAIEKQTLGKIEHVFAETEYTRQAISPYIDVSKTSVDTIGVDIQKFTPIPEEKRTDDYILSVGRFNDERKNITLLFEAYATLRYYMPNAPHLILAGKTPPSPKAWKKAEELGIREFIEMKEDISIEGLISLYQNAAVYVLTSDEEGLGIVLIEAMACATPVVSTRCGGPDSVVSSDTGFLIPIGNSHAIAEKLLWMLQNPEQRRMMGYAGRQTVISRFSNAVTGQKYLDVYEKLLGAE